MEEIFNEYLTNIFSDKHQLPGWMEPSPFAFPVRAALQGFIHHYFTFQDFSSFDIHQGFIHHCFCNNEIHTCISLFLFLSRNVLGRSRVRQLLWSTAISQVTFNQKHFWVPTNFFGSSTLCKKVKVDQVHLLLQASFLSSETSIRCKNYCPSNYVLVSGIICFHSLLCF